MPDGKGRYKKNRSGENLTISIKEALDRCGLSPVVRENIEALVRIRDAAVHLTKPSPNLPYLVFSLGAATLRNYSRLVRSWFGVGLSDFNFYILPLGFEYPFKSFSVADVKREAPDVASILRSVARAQQEDRVDDGDFSLVAEVTMTLVSAKKVTEHTDLVAKVDPSAPDAVVVTRSVRPIDQYPYTYTEVYNRLRGADPTLKQQRLNALIADRNVKNDPRYACYNYRSKREEQGGPKKTTAVLYNEAFLNFARSELCQEGLPLISSLPLVAPTAATGSDSAPTSGPTDVIPQPVMPPQPPISS